MKTIDLSDKKQFEFEPIEIKLPNGQKLEIREFDDTMLEMVSGFVKNLKAGNWTYCYDFIQSMTGCSRTQLAGVAGPVIVRAAKSILGAACDVLKGGVSTEDVNPTEGEAKE